MTQNNLFEIHILVKTRRCKEPELRRFTSTVDALTYLKKRNIKSTVVTINTVKNGKIHREEAILSTRTMGYTTI